MTGIRFIADKNAIVLVAEPEAMDGADDRTISVSAPFRIAVDPTRSVTDADVETWGTIGLMRMEEIAQSAARCLNAALSLDQEDFAMASQALEILVSQQLAKVDADDPVALMEEAMRYVLRQERWRFDILPEAREDGVRLQLHNPNGEDVPIGVHVSNRGKTPSFWVMQESRLIQGGHAYKIPIQAATSLKQAVTEYMAQHDTGAIRPYG